MNKKDVLELRKRFTKDCTISRMAGCYVDCNKNKVLKLNENFLNLGEDEFYKFLDIAKKTMSGTIGNNILELVFPAEEEEPGGKQQFLRALRESKLKNEDLLDSFYDLVIDRLTYTGNFLILVFYDNYDIITKTNDDLKIDESEEVYEYLLTVICPVELSKPGLGYRADENRIGARIRDWVVSAPAIGVLFPAFDNRSADIHKVDYFIRDTKDSHSEFVEEVLGCGAKRTATEQRMTFNQIVKRAYADSEEKAEDVILSIQESLESRLAENEEETEEQEPTVFDEQTVAEVLEESGVEGPEARMIKEVYKEEFADELPTVENLLDAKLLKANAQVKREKELVKEVLQLKEELKKQQSDFEAADENADSASAADMSEEENGGPDGHEVVLQVSHEKESLIRSQLIGEQRCLVIPLDDEDVIRINGRNS